MKSRSHLPHQTCVGERTSEIFSVQVTLQGIPSMLIRGKFNESRRGSGSNKKNSSDCSESRSNRGNEHTSSKSSRDNSSKGNKHSRIHLGRTTPLDPTSRSAINQISRSIRQVKVSKLSKIRLLKTTSSVAYLVVKTHSRTFSEVEDPLPR